MAHFGVPEPFPVRSSSTASTAWMVWMRQFAQYMHATGITRPTQKRALLLYIAGEDVQDVYETLTVPAPFGDQTEYDVTLAALTEYFGAAQPANEDVEYVPAWYALRAVATSARAADSHGEKDGGRQGLMSTRAVGIAIDEKERGIRGQAVKSADDQLDEELDIVPANGTDTESLDQKREQEAVNNRDVGPTIMPVNGTGRLDQDRDHDHEHDRRDVGPVVEPKKPDHDYEIDPDHGLANGQFAENIGSESPNDDETATDPDHGPVNGQCVENQQGEPDESRDHANLEDDIARKPHRFLTAADNASDGAMPTRPDPKIDDDADGDGRQPCERDDFADLAHRFIDRDDFSSQRHEHADNFANRDDFSSQRHEHADNFANRDDFSSQRHEHADNFANRDDFSSQRHEHADNFANRDDYSSQHHEHANDDFTDRDNDYDSQPHGHLDDDFTDHDNNYDSQPHRYADDYQPRPRHDERNTDSSVRKDHQSDHAPSPDRNFEAASSRGRPNALPFELTANHPLRRAISPQRLHDPGGSILSTMSRQMN